MNLKQIDKRRMNTMGRYCVGFHFICIVYRIWITMHYNGLSDMKKIFRHDLLFVILGSLLVILFVFRQYFFSGKILFQSNLLVSSYAPWKYEPPADYPHGPPNKPIGFDNVRQFFPDRKILSES